MAIHSSLTKAVRRTGENNKSLNTNSSIKKENFQLYTNRSNSVIDDSEATSFTSSMHGSTSTATSSNDRYNSGMEGGIRRKKTLDKSNSKKINGFESFRLSRRRPKSPLTSLADDGSATTLHPSPVEGSNPSSDHFQKPVQRFTRSGSLRSVRILRNKNRLPSESKKSPNVEDLHLKKSTFSSILKDSKFSEQEEPQVGVKEVLSVAKLCPYQHCSLHGPHHHEPPLERFAYLKRRSSNDKKSLNPTRTTNKQPGKKTEVKVGGKGRKNEDFDFSMEFYAKTRSEPISEASCSCDRVNLADIMFGVGYGNRIPESNIEDSSVMNDGNDGNSEDFTDFEGKNMAFNNGNQVSMWQLIDRYVLPGLVGEPASELDQQVDEEQQSCKDSDNHESEIRKMFAIKKVREAIEKILEVQDIQSIEVISEHDSLEKNQSDREGIGIPTTRNDQHEPNLAADDLSGTRKEKLFGWKKFILLKRFITELEKAKEFDLDKHKHSHLVTKPEPESGTLSLINQTIGEKKNSAEWMLDYALQQVVSELAPTQKRKVALLVKAFETVVPRLNDCPAKESSLNPDLEGVGSGVNGDYKEFGEIDVESLDQVDHSNMFSSMNSGERAIVVARGSELAKGKYIKMWHTIYQHVVADIATKVGSELLCDGDEPVYGEETNTQEVKGPNKIDHGLGFSRSDADTLIRQSVDKILISEIQGDASPDPQSLLEMKETYAEETQKQKPSKNWSKLRKLILLKRLIKASESSRKVIKPQTPSESVMTGEQEAKQVELRRQMTNERKKAEQWMMDYAVQHFVTKLTPARKKRVSMLVEAFESVIPLPGI